MRETGLVVNGFLFSTRKDYNAAKQEIEAIEHIKSNADITNPREALKIYSKLTEKKAFRTPVGYSFLKQLQDIVIKSDLVKIEDMEGIYVKTEEERKKEDGEDMISLSLSKYKELAEVDRIKLRNLRIINVFLVLIIIAMMVISIYSDKTTFINYKNDLLNEYAAWEEELESREQDLILREEQLEKDNLEENDSIGN